MGARQLHSSSRLLRTSSPTPSRVRLVLPRVPRLRPRASPVSTSAPQASVADPRQVHFSSAPLSRVSVIKAEGAPDERGELSWPSLSALAVLRDSSVEAGAPRGPQGDALGAIREALRRTGEEKWSCREAHVGSGTSLVAPGDPVRASSDSELVAGRTQVTPRGTQLTPREARAILTGTLRGPREEKCTCRASRATPSAARAEMTESFRDLRVPKPLHAQLHDSGPGARGRGRPAIASGAFDAAPWRSPRASRRANVGC
jgi:hypothetical protein